MEETKNGLRSAALMRRSALSPAACLAWSRLIQIKTLELPQYLAARSVALYRATQNEVETDAIMDHALRQRKKVFYPCVSGKEPAVFGQIFSAEDLVPGSFGLAEPAGEIRICQADCESLIVIVPGVLFDCRGNRLGRGGGWYDRALRWFGGRGVYVGLAYDFQVVDRVPVQSWDEKVHYVITESRVLDCDIASQREVVW